MFNWLRKLFPKPELLRVTAISTGTIWQEWVWPHTWVELPDGRRLAVAGIRGKPGDVFHVWSNQLWEAE